MKFDGFLLALAGAVLLAIAWPQLGATGGPVRLDLAARYGAALIFFLYGLTLSPARLRAGAMKWRVHLIVQGTTFLMFPLVMLAVGLVLQPGPQAPLWLGFLYVAALPTTISSSVAMTSLARGDVPAAIFNATISALLGVVATPALMAVFVGGLGGQFPLGPVVLKVALLVLAPLAAGQAARVFLRRFAERHGGRLKQVDRIVILAIIVNAFSDSILQGVWRAQSPLAIAVTVAGVCVLFAAAYGWMALCARALGLPREERIAAMFCGSNKSLVNGAPMAPVIFGAAPALGVILAPLMAYHLVQLVVISVIASRYAAEPARAT